MAGMMIHTSYQVPGIYVYIHSSVPIILFMYTGSDHYHTDTYICRCDMFFVGALVTVVCFGGRDAIRRDQTDARAIFRSIYHAM